MAFTQEQQDLLFGTLLGDGNLVTETEGRTWRYRVLHKLEHKPYVMHKYTVMKNYCGTPPTDGEVEDPRTGKIYYRSSFNTLSTPQLKYYGDFFYKKDFIKQNDGTSLLRMIKVLPSHDILMKQLTPRAVAYWYMDDGSVKYIGKSNAMRISSQSFTNEENDRLIQVVSKKYNIQLSWNTRKTTQGDRRILTIPEKSSTAFRELILEYLTIPCMRYKMTDGNKGHII